MIRFERLTTVNDAAYSQAMDLYKISFPPHEQREGASQIRIMADREYQFNLIYDENEFVGMILCWETDAFIYVEHFCILPEKRNKNYGQRALELLNNRGKTVILEIDPPLDDISIRRKAFYERVNYRANGFEHIHPPYHRGMKGHRLVVMSCPERLSDSEYNEFNDHLKNRVMGQ